jgi:hypothetical protein
MSYHLVSIKMSSKTDVSAEAGEVEIELTVDDSNIKNSKYVKSTFFVLSNVFFDRFSYGGIFCE